MKNVAKTQQEQLILLDILHRMNARYMTVRPQGIDPGEGRKMLTTLDCRILNYGGARSLYRGRRPVCRSLDGITSIQEPKKHCQECYERKHCTSQVRLDLLFESRSYRLLLAYSSAKNFLLYAGEISTKKLVLHKVITTVRVLNRGSWGELRFSGCPE